MKKKSSMPDLKIVPFAIFGIIIIAFFWGGWDKISAASPLQHGLAVLFLLGAAAFVYRATKVVGNAMLGIWLLIGGLLCLALAISSALGYIF